MSAGADVLVVMAKYPTPGAVKTRLAERVGAEAACALYGAFLGDISERVSAGPWSLCWAVTPPEADLAPFIGAGGRQLAQQGDDLGARMRACFVRLFGEGAGRVVMIGADAPHLVGGELQSAFAALDADDAVFVPTRDGGYCLVGMRAPYDVFSGVAMGTSAVFAATRARLDTLGLRWRALAQSFDVDELQDATELARLLAAGRVCLPRTAAVLRAWQSAGLLP